MASAAAPYPEGAPCWADVALGDPAAGKRFYGELLGWTFGQPAESYGGYTEAYLDGAKVAALAAKPDGRMPTAWNIYFATPDLGAAAQRVTAAGGQLIAGPARVGGLGRALTAADPGGSVFGVRQPGGSDADAGFERTGEPGSYCWVENHTREPRAVDAFYEAVFGYAPSESPQAPGHRLLSPRGSEPGAHTAVAGREVLGGLFPAEMPPHYLLYFRVFDADETAAVARRLGGRVQLEPREGPYGRWAILTDNQGARFAVLSHPRGVN
ncbi:VOC family protein [Streptomyces polyrhachis]|uniref:VOC family protein n=1 Tax=Streptomyces polyrhachis TaxID=1282885 RepID=A0ABW2GIB3_9ACTN